MVKFTLDQVSGLLFPLRSAARWTRTCRSSRCGPTVDDGGGPNRPSTGVPASPFPSLHPPPAVPHPSQLPPIPPKPLGNREPSVRMLRAAWERFRGPDHAAGLPERTSPRCLAGPREGSRLSRKPVQHRRIFGASILAPPSICRRLSVNQRSGASPAASFLLPRVGSFARSFLRCSYPTYLPSCAAPSTPCTLFSSPRTVALFVVRAIVGKIVQTRYPLEKLSSLSQHLLTLPFVK